MQDRREGPGRFVFHDLMSCDVARSLEFYSSLMPEWDIQGIDLGEAGTYHVIRIHGRKCGGIVPVEPSSGLMSHWIGYVEVDDCDAVAACAIAEGGKVPVPAMSIPGLGKFAVLMDRQQALLKTLEPSSPIEFPAEVSSGDFCWNELLTTDIASARAFYQSVFGWSAVEQFAEGKGEFTLMRSGEHEVAGLMPMSNDSAHSPTWLTYLYAEDLDDRVRRAERNAAQVAIAPREIPGVDRFAVLVDPVGAVFALTNRSSNSRS